MGGSSLTSKKTSRFIQEHVVGLKCRDCGKEFEIAPLYVCDECFGALDIIYDFEKISFSKSDLKSRENTLWRYKEFLPFEAPEYVSEIKAGFTPLIRAKLLAKKLGLKELYIKNDCVNPTYSFKDRPAALGVTAALSFGMKSVGCASTGNLASATAAYAARVGLPCYIIIPNGIEVSKISQAQSYGAKIVAVEGTYDDANRLATQAAELFNIGMVNINLRPYYVEGSKTLALEVAEQLNWEAPDVFIVPTASGAMFNAICRGFEQLLELGLINHLPKKPVVAQASGCNPISKAFKEGRDYIEVIENPNTIAHSLAIGNPGDGVYVLRRLKQGGLAEDVSDQEIIEGIKLLAQNEGIYAEPAGGVAIAVLKKLVEEGKIQEDERVVCYVTGSGLKTPETLKGKVEEPILIKPQVKYLESILTWQK
jgi:threonine synthase